MVVVGEIDRAIAHDLAAALTDAVAATKRIEVDLSRTTFMDASGLRALNDAPLRLGPPPDAVVVCDPHPALRWVFDMPGIDEFLQLG